MDISSNMPSVNTNQKSTNIQTSFTQKISSDQVSEIKAQIAENAKAMMFSSTSIQSNVSSTQDQFTKNYEEFSSFLEGIGYSGQPIAELSQEEAAELVSEDGLFGVKQTSERIANFVINGANGNEDRIRAGREGMLEGFKQAEAMWGGELPEISQQTMAKAIEMVDMAMNDLGFSIINTEA